MRRYGQDCPLARSLDVLGERWTLLIIRELLLGERRYKELSRALKGMGTNLLAARLQDLSAHGMITKDGRKDAYRLTAQGEALRAIVYELIRWDFLTAEASGTPDDIVNEGWDLLLLQALVRSPPPKRLSLTANLALGHGQFHAVCRSGTLTLTGGHQDDAQVFVRASLTGFRQLCQRSTAELAETTRSFDMEGPTKPAFTLLGCWSVP